MRTYDDLVSLLTRDLLALQDRSELEKIKNKLVCRLLLVRSYRTFVLSLSLSLFVFVSLSSCPKRSGVGL